LHDKEAITTEGLAYVIKRATTAEGLAYNYNKRNCFRDRGSNQDYHKKICFSVRGSLALEIQIRILANTIFLEIGFWHVFVQSILGRDTLARWGLQQVDAIIALVL